MCLLWVTDVFVGQTSGLLQILEIGLKRTPTRSFQLFSLWLVNKKRLHPRTWTWNLKITQLKRKIIWTKPSWLQVPAVNLPGFETSLKLVPTWWVGCFIGSHHSLPVGAPKMPLTNWTCQQLGFRKKQPQFLDNLRTYKLNYRDYDVFTA